jgi:hypothetical protein
MFRLSHCFVRFHVVAVILLSCQLLSGCIPAGTKVTGPAAASMQESTYSPIYHGIFPGGKTGEEDDITLADVTAYERAAGKKVAWVYVSNNWYTDRRFPTATATWIRQHGAVPFIRLMLLDSWRKPRTNKDYSLDSIAAGKFDKDLKAWARAARDFKTPLLVEYGTEANGHWFPWNGQHNGKSRGPEKFKKAYRHIIDVMKKEGANNIRWVFHVDVDDNPHETWNRFENYFPGHNYIDWFGFSAYGAATPMADEWPSFRELVDPVYPRLADLAKGKPIVVLEFGVTSGHPKMDQAKWAEAALKDIVSGRWPGLLGFSWWNEAWENDNNPAHNTNMRVQDNPKLSAVFKRLVRSNPRIKDRLSF